MSVRSLSLTMALAVAVLTAVAAGAARTAPASKEPVRTELDRTLKLFVRMHPAFPGVALTVRAPGLAWTGAAGFADKASRKPLRPDATFRVASLTKTFTSAAILRLAEDGKLAIDDPMGQHLSSSSVGLLRDGGYDVDAIRVRHLLQHTSGIYDYAEDKAFQAFVLGHPRHRWTRTEQIRWAMTHGKPLSAPGAKYNYSDTGYVLLGEMLERLTGRDLAAAYRTLLRFDRIGLDETYLETLEPKPVKAKPRAHQYVGTFDATAVHPSFDLYGGGGHVSTVDDLARFYRALVGGRIFKRASTLQTMLGKVPAARPGDLGLGIVGFKVPGHGTCWGHGGFWGVVAGHCPRTGVTIASTVNQRNGFEAASSQLHAAVYRLLGRA